MLLVREAHLDVRAAQGHAYAGVVPSVNEDLAALDGQPTGLGQRSVQELLSNLRSVDPVGRVVHLRTPSAGIALPEHERKAYCTDSLHRETPHFRTARTVTTLDEISPTWALMRTVALVRTLAVNSPEVVKVRERSKTLARAQGET